MTSIQLNSNEETPRIIFLNFVLALVYLISGHIGQSLAIEPTNVSALWPATAVALGALLIYGYKLLPGIMLGAVLLHMQLILLQDGTVQLISAFTIAFSIAIGVTVQSYLGTYLINRSLDIKTGLFRAVDIVKLLFIGGPFSCLPGASWGIITLWLFNQLPENEAGFSWFIWWIRESVGVIIFLPVILVLFAQPRSIWKSYRLPVALPILIALVAVTFIFFSASEKENQFQQSQFRETANQLADALEDQMIKNIEVLYSVKNFLNSSSEIERNEYNQYVQRSLLRNPGIKALGWNRVVSRQERSDFERRVRSEGFPEFTISERDTQGQLVSAQTYEKHVVVDYIVPLAGNEKAFGYDVYSNQSRRIALDLAASSGKLVATSAIRLVQETGHQTGVLFMLPVYKVAELPQQEQREQMIKGFIVGVYRLGDLVASALDGMSLSNIHVHLDDITPGAGRHQLSHYAFNAKGRGRLLDIVDNHDSTDVLMYQKDFEFGQRLWRFSVDVTPEYLKHNRAMTSWYVQLTGLLFIAMMGGFLLIISTSNLQDKMRMQELDKEIKQRKSIATALHHANNELEKLATTDSLTNVHNRRSIEHLGKAFEADSLRYHGHYCVIMLDIDHFKQVNDRWGHKMGDKVLLNIASKAKSQLRDTDFIGRWGGEEFIILSRHISLDASVDFARRVCQTVSQLEIDSVGQVTISIGVARNHSKESFEDVLSRADEAMYLAKERGRNRVEAIA